MRMSIAIAIIITECLIILILSCYHYFNTYSTLMQEKFSHFMKTFLILFCFFQ